MLPHPEGPTTQRKPSLALNLFDQFTPLHLIGSSEKEGLIRDIKVAPTNYDHNECVCSPLWSIFTEGVELG